jgi:hypothetical protein
MVKMRTVQQQRTGSNNMEGAATSVGRLVVVIDSSTLVGTLLVSTRIQLFSL